MRTKLFFSIAGFLISLISCSQDFNKLSDSKVDQGKLNFSTKFAEDFMTAVSKGATYEFTDEAIDQIKNMLTADNQKNLYKQLESQFGEYQSMEYAETWSDSNGSGLMIFRFKAKFSKSPSVLEVRVVVNKDNKIAGFWIKPWSDLLGG